MELATRHEARAVCRACECVYLEEVYEVDERQSVELRQQVHGGARLVGAGERLDASLVERERNDRFAELAVPELEQRGGHVRVRL